MAKYRVLKGLDYPPNKRAEVGAVVEDLPAAAIKWLLEDGVIEDATKPTKVEAKVEPVVEAPIVTPVEETPVEETPVAEGFDPEATDGDGDGFVQDGTPFQRPVEEK
jgi:hypothetical protein